MKTRTPAVKKMRSGLVRQKAAASRVTRSTKPARRADVSLLSCRKFDVIRRFVTGSDGRRHAREIVVHPGAAVVLPILPDGRFLLIDQHRHTLNRQLLELPAGTLDVKNESPRKCAARELEEETGYVARRISPLCKLYPSPGIMTEIIHAFVATGLTLKSARPEATEDIRLRAMTPNEAMTAVLDGTIVDAKTMITLMYHQLRLERSA